jgi:Family of unknown function (DUF6511)
MADRYSWLGMCFCRRRHCNLGYAPTEKHTVLWACEECLPLTQTVYQMPQKRFDEFERKALLVGGDKAGEYLDSIGVTDLANLQPEEWQQFLEKVLGGYSEQMRKFASGEAPF